MKLTTQVSPSGVASGGAMTREQAWDVLGLKPGQVDKFTNETGLFGDLPELDSMAVAGLLTEMEDRLDIVIDEDEIVSGALIFVK